MKTKDKIIHAAIDLFNKGGVIAITTNHIAKELSISPGNLYFHFRNKEQIIREIFQLMTRETYDLWSVKKRNSSMEEVILENYELYWKYRFFHREMYHLRRSDSLLNKQWKKHIEKIKKLMTIHYRHWVKTGAAKNIETSTEKEFILNVLLATASTFLHFFESSEKLPAKKHVERGKLYVMWILYPWTLGQTRADFSRVLNDA